MRRPPFLLISFVGIFSFLQFVVHAPRFAFILGGALAGLIAGILHRRASRRDPPP
ncbi:MAG: hypothetical protein RLZZ324_896 [Candidatus Parcubacteria bacterium]|jgi:hypothetical protein